MFESCGGCTKSSLIFLLESLSTADKLANAMDSAFGFIPFAIMASVSGILNPFASFLTALVLALGPPFFCFGDGAEVCRFLLLYVCSLLFCDD